MPLYDYFCDSCENEFEEKISYEEIDNKKIKCPKCKSQKTKRIINAKPFVRYIGDGWTQGIDRLTDE